MTTVKIIVIIIIMWDSKEKIKYINYQTRTDLLPIDLCRADVRWCGACSIFHVHRNFRFYSSCPWHVRQSTADLRYTYGPSLLAPFACSCSIIWFNFFLPLHIVLRVLPLKQITRDPIENRSNVFGRVWWFVEFLCPFFPVYTNDT